MKITDKREEREKFLTIEEIYAGDIFSFLGNDDVYMLVDDGDHYVDLLGGSCYEIEDHELNQPIELLDAELVINRRLKQAETPTFLFGGPRWDAASRIYHCTTSRSFCQEFFEKNFFYLFFPEWG